jgi:hypothetical protein
VKCAAFVEKRVNDSVIFVPCHERSSGPKGKDRYFCDHHARAYREIFLGVIMMGPREEKSKNGHNHR